MARTKYSLLALDGGGIRGVIPARVLHAIEQRTGRPISQLFDLVAGTSTGGILALGLTKPAARGSSKPAYSASNLLDFYLNEGERIFPRKSLWERVRRGPIPVAYANANGWGLAHWARPVLEVVFDGVAEAVEYQLKRLCRDTAGGGPRYHRLQSSLPTAAHAMDDASAMNLRRLMDDASTLIRKEAAELEQICSILEDVAADRDAALV